MDTLTEARCHVCGIAADHLREGYYVHGNPVPILYYAKCGKNRNVMSRWAYAVRYFFRRLIVMPT